MKPSPRDSYSQRTLFELDLRPSNRVSEQTMSVSIPELQGVSTTKRGFKEQAGLHGWHPYYAGYAEKFVDDTIGILANKGDLILDPWNGSGTTTLAAQKRGYQAIGIEINPVMAIHSKAKD